MNVFVTGATGFVGRHFVNAAVLRNHKVFCLRRNGNNIKNKFPSEIVWQDGNLDQLLSRDIKNIDVLVHFAATGVSPRKATWEELYYWNVATLLRLLKVAYEGGVKKIILAGSQIEYGLSSNEYDFIPPTASLRPTTPYGASKAAGFELAHGFCADNGLPLVYKRIFSAYGTGQHENNFWPSLRKAAISGHDFPMTVGDQIRDFIPVEEVALNFVRSVEDKDPKDGNPLVENVCTGIGQSVREFAEYWWLYWKAKGQLKLGEIPSRKNEPMRFVGKH